MHSPSTSNSTFNLPALLSQGNTIVKPLQGYKARNKVTCICTVDIDNDGDIEIIFGCADGRLTVLSSDGEVRWSRIIGDKSPVTTIAILSRNSGTHTSRMIVAGTERGYLYVFNKYGQAIRKDGTSNPADLKDAEGKDEDEYWFAGDQAINQISVTYGKSSNIIFSSEDCHVYALRGSDGTELWSAFQTSRWARCVFAYDLDGDKNIEVLASTTNNYLYQIDHNGRQIREQKMGYHVRALFVVDLDNDGSVKILVATDNGDLVALGTDFQQLWCVSPFTNRVRALYVADIDRDNKREIIAGGDDKYIYILDTRGTILWRHFLDARITSISVDDIDEDGLQEIIVGADDERVHILHIDLSYARKGLYQRIQKAYQPEAPGFEAMLAQLTPSEHELLRSLTDNKREKPISLEQAEAPFQQGHFKDALIAFLQLQLQKVQIQWQQKTGYDARLLSFGSSLGDLIVGTADGELRGYATSGKPLWRCSLPDQILSAQVGRIQSSRQDDILVCSTDRQVYLVGYPPDSARDTKPQILKQYNIDSKISSVALKSEFRNTEVVFGSEDQKIYIYRDGLDQAKESVPTDHSIRLIQLYPSRPSHKHQTPDIITANADHYVVAYKYGSKQELWRFRAWNRIRAISVKDIDGDSCDEILVGADDRNVHVLDDQGNLKWRYYFPYSVLSIHVEDIDQNGCQEVLVGCADGYLYVLGKDGKLLWHYHVDERITAITSRKFEQIVEIALGTENKVELLQVVNTNYLQAKIERCWHNLVGKQSEEQVVRELLRTPQEPVLHAFALQKAATVLPCNGEKQELLKKFSKDRSTIVRQAVVQGLLKCYDSNPAVLHPLLERLFSDREREVRLTFIADIDQLMKQDWAVGLDYLGRFAENVDRFVRRVVMRKLYSLINEPDKSYWKEDYWKQIFHLLLVGVRDQKSTWVCQEAARSLARFLEERPWDILQAIHLFLSKDVKPPILLYMAHHITRQRTLRETLESLVQLLQDDLRIDNATERLNMAAQTLASIQDSKFGRDTWLLFQELHHLFSLQTLQDIAQYQSRLKDYQPTPENLHFATARRVFESISNVTRILKVYLHRQNVNDRITSLQETCRAVERLRQFMHSEYRMALPNEALTKSPDYKFFDLLFEHWWNIAQNILNEMQGKPEIEVRLLTPEMHYEPMVSMLLEIRNIGRSPAYGVRAALLHNTAFSTEPPAVTQSEILFWNEILRAEFTIQLNTYTECLDLEIEVTFDDGEEGFQKQLSPKQLTLRTMETSEYEFIPNPYSTGTPVKDKKMFFGREHDIEVLKRELTQQAAQRIIILHGLRRSGKTSLLRHLVDNNVLTNCIPVYVDMQNIIHEVTTDRLFYKIAFQMHRTITRRQLFNLPVPMPMQFKEDAPFAFDRFLDDVEMCIRDQQRIVLLIDEFEILDQQAERGMLAPTLFAYLRSLMQERKINFLLAGTHKIEQLTREYWSVFYGLVLPHRLSKISLEGAQDLITLPMKDHLTYDPFVIDKIRQLAGDQPFLLNSFCRILVDNCNELRKSHVSLYDLHALLPQAVKVISLQFDGLWQQISQEEQCALAAIATIPGDRALTYAEIEDIYRTQRVPYDPQQLDKSLRSLTQQDLLESVMEGSDQDSRRYRISMGLLKTWLNEEHMLTTLEQKRVYRTI